MNIKVNAVGRYRGHSLRENGNVDFSIKLGYDNLTKTVQLMQMLNNDVNIVVKLPDSKSLNLGSFRIKNISVDDDGESTVKFNSLNDFVEVDNLNAIVTKELFKIKFEADVEEEEDAEE